MIETSLYGLSEQDLYLFNQGSSYHSYRFMGAHPIVWEGIDGVRFTVWAPNASEARVIGDFNNWNGKLHVMVRQGTTGIFTLFVPELSEGELYKYELITRDGIPIRKSDPYAFLAERRPGTASVVTNLTGYHWGDEEWQSVKKIRKPYSNPLLIYEVHIGSWKIKGKEIFYTYEEMADDIIPYLCDMGYTHIELMPIMEHPLDQSWGYQITGFYSATSRYGNPNGLMRFIDSCHQNDIGIILDWVPGHFCKDNHGLRLFDGTPIFEGADSNRAELPQWGTLAFDFSKREVLSFLISNAIFWMDIYHIDGLRVDAVANMLNLHMDKPHHMYTYNEFGGRDNLDALRFLKRLNETVFHYYPDTLMLAEDSSAWPAVTSPTYKGGLGFNFKWNMGWMNDMLRYMELDPFDRPGHHHLITFSLCYAFSENYVLPLSHDEVVHGKKSLLNKMPGSYEEKFQQLKLFYGYWMTHPGKKLLFMGGEWGQFDEWKDGDMLDWMVLQYDSHNLMQQYVKTLNQTYRQLPSLWERDSDHESFSWIDVHNYEQSVISFIRCGFSSLSIIVANFSRNDYHDYRIGVPEPGNYYSIIHSNDILFGGGVTQAKDCYVSENIMWHGREQSISIHLPPLTFLLLSPHMGDTI
ncbi:1,4-alpha-glucan branching protein GlgB [Paenibacillus sp. GSMTC-2017]|uniref:1,4-alpha-glucan branching protein GlgB n=1 Tax=Paenibacillus sp. GSMTC-2017 TaxID=2794350 RepID=UPI0018D81947|nr:1,4-alpha-glucan branching protein GlgB [Paenibacillus sp. GSMTC-2017]MBH5318105.1 1,4-alpha-glucan branching protein GlgB [Paenibacillus sp. GSMTC-2017]